MSLKSEREEIYQGRISRRTIFRLSQAAKTVGNHRFLRQLATAWLTSFPGDLEVQRNLAESWLLDGRIDMARPILETLFTLDPENKLVFDLLARINNQDLKEIEQLQVATQAFNDGNFEAVENNLPEKGSDTALLLSGIVRLKLARRMGDLKMAHVLASQYHQHWPSCLQFRLGLVQAAMELGHPDDAVALLHRCAADDAAGMVVRRWLGEDHPFRTLWPEKMSISFDLPIPAEISALLGWNQLPFIPGSAITTGQLANNASKSAQSADLADIEAEFERIAGRIKQPSPTRLDGRYPVYVIFTLEHQLNAIYGNKTTEIIMAEIIRLAEAIRERKNWGALVFCPDNTEIVGKIGIAPCSTCFDPWKLKLSLVDLDRSLAQRGERIGALLIVGGPEIVPFHHLPNPLDDPDTEVLSDNPYATQDSNYFVPEWPVGRLPGESGKDAGLLIQQIRKATRYHRNFMENSREQKKIKYWFGLSWLRNCIKRVFSRPESRGFGYTAAAWRRSSQAVFRATGHQKTLLASPPQGSTDLSALLPLGASLGYYNLHGVPDSAEWFGQREFNDPLPGPDYPVALTPANLHVNGHHPEIVFSEACYGANLRDDKTTHSSIALRFLSVGAKAFIGSTCTSYGAVTMPLAGADLMAYRFWKLLREGYCVGEALLQAKIQFAQELMRRQGYLDGEDQKTLISFVLFGDPLSTPEESPASAPKGIERAKSSPAVKTVCDRNSSEHFQNTSNAEISEEALQHIKQVVAPYLPGLDHAKVFVSTTRPPCAHLEKNCPGCVLAERSKTRHDDGRTVVTFSQQTRIDRHAHTSIARVTLNREGKVTKLALSR